MNKGKNKEEITCPNCNSKLIVKAGLKKLKNQTIQRYKCNSCNKYFSNNNLKHKSYKANIIINTISLYNLGNTLNKTQKLVAKKFKTNIPLTTIHSWLSQYKNICTFSRLRKQAIKLYSPERILISQKLQHNQIYNFQLHRAKLQLSSKELPKQKYSLLKLYLNNITKNSFPHHIFQPKLQTKKLPRSSKIKFNHLKIVKLKKQNLANKLASLGVLLAESNKQRHEKIQNFMLINDSTTIAAEVPVYLTKDDINYFKSKGFSLNLKNYTTPITGHIDILQIRNNLIHILDYKPDAKNQNPINQLSMYALALASRTKLDLKSFKCAWFDENSYYEFFPLHVVYKKK